MSLFLLLIGLFILSIIYSSVMRCFAVIVGRGASEDGSVIFGHNEQDSGKRILNFRRVPRIKHFDGEFVKLRRGGRLAEVPETYSFIWSENPGLEFSDVYFNEWGVAIASDGCPTREDEYDVLVARGDIVDGGIGYMLRRLIAQRATSAKEGIHIAGELIDKFGYVDSGRSLVIADPSDAWVLSIVRGKHWIARKVPDDEVVILPNVHIIDKVDLNDKDNFAGSPDIIEYAIKRGWYDPSSGKEFSFREAYNPPNVSLRDKRQFQGQSMVTSNVANIPLDEQLQFSVKPDRKLNVKDVMRILRYHDKEVSLCSPETLEGAVFQLRRWMPKEIGCIYWRTSAEPCVSAFIPWYLGVTEIPEIYHKPVPIEENLTLDHHFNPPKGTFEYDPNHAWWMFRRLQDALNGDYQGLKEMVRKMWDDFERDIFANQAKFEKEALDLLMKDHAESLKMITDYSKGLSSKAIEMASDTYERLLNLSL